jgi:branched-chain amino acid transport system ATP-binding protein
MPEVLQIEKLSAGYGEAVVLSDVSLRIEEGRSLALLGRNGMGKTTLLNSIVGVTRRFGGAIRLAGNDITRLKERRRNLGNQLSGGEQQMLAIGRALVLNPRLLLLDEPLEGLAPILVQELISALSRVMREEGLSAILVEQNAQKILSVTDRAAILERGTIVHESTSAALKADPKVLEEYLGVGKTRAALLAPKAG